jgi:hypothetical protein
MVNEQAAPRIANEMRTFRRPKWSDALPIVKAEMHPDKWRAIPIQMPCVVPPIVGELEKAIARKAGIQAHMPRSSQQCAVYPRVRRSEARRADGVVPLSV